MALIFACAAGLMEKSKMQIILNHLGSLLQSQCQESSGLWWMALSFAAGNISLHHSARACSWIPPLYRLGLLRQRCCDTPLRPLDPAFRSPLPHAKHPQFLYSSLQFRVALDQTSLATYYFSTDSLNAHIFKQNPFLAVWNGLSWVWKGKPFQNILQMDG